MKFEKLKIAVFNSLALLLVLAPAQAAFNPSNYSAPPQANISAPNPSLPTITADSFGMKCDGTTNDQTAWGNVITFLNANGGNLLFPLGGKTCIVNGVQTISTTKGVFIEGNNTTLKVLSGAANTSGFVILKFTGSNIVIQDLTGDGNLSGRTGTAVNKTPNFLVLSGHNITFRNVHSINAVLDNYYVSATDEATQSTWPTNIVFDHCYGSGAYRNSMSLIDVIGWDVIGGSYDLSSGTAPQAGIDIEPDGGNHTVRNGSIIGVSMTGNLGIGLSITSSTGMAANDPQNIFVDNVHVDCTSNPTAKGFGMESTTVQVGSYFSTNCAIAIGGSRATTLNIGSIYINGSTPAAASATMGFSGQVSGNIGSIFADGIDETSGNGLSFPDSNGLIFGSVTVENTTGANVGFYNLSIGGNTTINAAFFYNDYNDHIAVNSSASVPGNNVITNVTAVSPHLGIGGTTAQAIIKPGPGDVIDNIVATGANASGEYGVRWFSNSEPAHIGYTKLLNFGSGGLVAASGNGPLISVSGSTLLTSIVEVAYYTGAAGSTLTLPLSTTYTLGGSQAKITVYNTGSAAVTIAADTGDSLAGGASIANPGNNTYQLDATTKVWTNAQ